MASARAPETSSVRMTTAGMSQRDLDALLSEFDRPHIEALIASCLALGAGGTAAA